MWIDDQFDGLAFLFPDSAWWNVGEKISEKDFVEQQAREREDGITLVEAQAVYHCRQAEGPSVGKQGIMKIRMQVPLPSNRPYTYDERCALAIYEPGAFTQQELSTLQWFNERNCSAVPQLYTWLQADQPEDSIIPGGYVVILVMEKLPGVPLWDFWTRTPEQWRKIRVAFKLALTLVYLNLFLPLTNTHASSPAACRWRTNETK